MRPWIILSAVLSLTLLGCDEYSGSGAKKDKAPQQAAPREQPESPAVKPDAKKDSDVRDLKTEPKVEKAPTDEAKSKTEQPGEPEKKEEKKDQPPGSGTPPKEPAPGPDKQ